ncbi:hypothetical protein [Curtobacterium sp. 9128]|uniref:hypothetical protein n=1 Tax=Curtobacterium sp. 9128 TaxID=1793722 RepID=UPI00119E96C7|nr:hypothetical protein [Curtobacterium sp. 9128]
MSFVGAWGGTSAGAFDEPYRRLLEAHRDGTLERGVPLRDVEVARTIGVPRLLVRGGLARLADAGLATMDDQGTVVLHVTGFASWHAAQVWWLAVFELTARTAVPVLTDEDVEAFETLVTATARQGALRSDTFAPLFTDCLRFLVDRSPNALARREAGFVLDELLSAQESVPAWAVWDSDAFLLVAARAARSRDPELMVDAVHAYADLATGPHLDSVRAAFGLPSEPAPAWERVDPEDLEPPWRRDPAWRTVLGAVRSGVLPRGTEHTVGQLAQRFGMDLPVLMPQLRRLQQIGLAEPTADGAVRLTDPTLADWRDAGQLLDAASERCTALVVPLLTPADRRALADLVELLRYQSTVHDQAFTASVLQTARFFAERCGSPRLRNATRIALARVAYVVDHPPDFEQWFIEDYLAPLEQAAADADPMLATEASHALRRHADRQFATAMRNDAARYGTMDA